VPVARPECQPDILDVLIVGAGLSGIGAAHRLQRRCPSKRYAVVEARTCIGGTWDLFRYPGVRSDSDMYTLGYDFKPWTGAKAIADGPAILQYIRDAADQTGITQHIRFGHTVRSAQWSSRDAYWTLETELADTGQRVSLRARFVYLCCGYFSYSQDHRPEFAALSEYRGRIVHPQFWPTDLDYAGKHILVIGSGATAVTLVPEMAKTAAHVTMLQRSPTYVVTRPSEDRFAQRLQQYLPSGLAYRLARWKNVFIGMFYFELARRRPEAVKQRIINMARSQLGAGCDVETHFTPRYRPWDQRVCLVPDGDLFRKIRQGRAAVMTDTIECFTQTGVKLRSGQEISADIVVLATGLQLNVLGDVAIHIDGRHCDLGQTMAYKGMMLSGVPNLAMAFGYTNASWTLKADLTAGYVCRLLRYMDRHGFAIAVPRPDPAELTRPFLSFTSGYVQRALTILPKQGSQAPWRVYQNYLLDLFALRYGRIADGVMGFGRAGAMP
jgi:cyclohexanone monooxygenase